ncbi:MAG: hypothetical protein M3Z14_07165, partial [Candidatus Eremiobacteraeota bacterium]|nr:hypothetical protein [Candidatus Eremiobacteraeota bacterium]
MFTLSNFSPLSIIKLTALLALATVAGCSGGGCCEPPANVNHVGGVIPPGTGPGAMVTVPAVTIGNGGTATIPITGTGPFTAVGCPGIVNATVNGNILNLTSVGAGLCVVVVTSPGGGKGTITVTVTPAPPLVVTPVTLQLGPGGSGAVTVTGTGPFTATGCPGIVNATVTGNVVNLVAVGVGVCAVIITGPGGVQATVVTTVSAGTPAITINPPTITLAPGATAGLPITGTGPFTATGCPGIINATVNGNVLNLVAAGVGVCVVVVTGPNGVQATVLATVTGAALPLVVTPTTLQLAPGGTGSVAVTGSGPFNATGCQGIINATVTGNVVNLAAVGVGVCAVVITGPNGVQATVLATVAATTPLALTPTSVQLLPNGTGAVAITGTGPFTATSCPGIVKAVVTGNVLNLAAIGVGVCVVVVTDANGVKANVVATVAATPAPISLSTPVVQLLPNGTANVGITGMGPFTVTSCPNVTATVNGNILTLAAGAAVGVCAVVVTGPGGVQATVVATVAAGLALSPAAVQLGVNGTSDVAITGTGPFTVTGCPGIIGATVSGNV